MKTAIQNFEYEGKLIEFDFGNQNIMVNATEMAKLFGKDLFQFSKSEGVKSFISEALKPANAGLLGIEKEEDLILSRQKSGTWMHRVLALKFAAWLDPAFEIWVFLTIDKILFGTMREDSIIKSRIDIEKEKLLAELSNNPDYLRLIELESEGKKMVGKIMKQQKTQLQLFMEGNVN